MSCSLASTKLSEHSLLERHNPLWRGDQRQGDLSAADGEVVMLTDAHIVAAPRPAALPTQQTQRQPIKQPTQEAFDLGFHSNDDIRRPTNFIQPCRLQTNPATAISSAAMPVKSTMVMSSSDVRPGVSPASTAPSAISASSGTRPPRTAWPNSP